MFNAETRNGINADLSSDVIEAGVTAYWRWYSQGGADENAIPDLVATILSAALGEEAPNAGLISRDGLTELGTPSQ